MEKILKTKEILKNIDQIKGSKPKYCAFGVKTIYIQLSNVKNNLKKI